MRLWRLSKQPRTRGKFPSMPSKSDGRTAMLYSQQKVLLVKMEFRRVTSLLILLYYDKDTEN